MIPVTLIGPWPPPFGGVSVHVLRLATSLPQEAWGVRIVSAGAHSALAGTPREHLGNSPFRHAVVPRRLSQGVVHLHDRIPLLSAIAAASVRSRRLPLILTIHGEPRRTVSRGSGVDLFLRAAIRMADVTIAVSEDVAQALQSAGARRRIRILPAFLPPSERELHLIDPELLQWIDHDADVVPLVTFVSYRALPPIFGGRDVYGIRDTVKLAERLSLAGLPFKLLWLLAMEPHTDEEKSLVTDAVARLHRAAAHRFRYLVGEYAVPALARSRVLLRPTASDGDSVTVREALALGVSVIASDVAPRPQGTVVVPAGDADALFQAVASALSGRRKDVTHSVCGPSCLEELEQIYRELASTRPVW